MSVHWPHSRKIAATPSRGIVMGRSTGLRWNSTGKSWYWRGGEPPGPDARLKRGDVRGIPGNTGECRGMPENVIGERFSNLSR